MTATVHTLHPEKREEGNLTEQVSRLVRLACVEDIGNKLVTINGNFSEVFADIEPTDDPYTDWVLKETKETLEHIVAQCRYIERIARNAPRTGPEDAA